MNNPLNLQAGQETAVLAFHQQAIAQQRAALAYKPYSGLLGVKPDQVPKETYEVEVGVFLRRQIRRLLAEEKARGKVRGFTEVRGFLNSTFFVQCENTWWRSFCSALQN